MAASGAGQIATGPYARINRHEQRTMGDAAERGRTKDQNVTFCSADAKSNFGGTMFRWGESRRSAVRALAAELASYRAGSTIAGDLFVSQTADYAAFIASLFVEQGISQEEKTGGTGHADERGREPAGVHHFTVANRRGIGIARPALT